jgi:hypothetical protein
MWFQIIIIKSQDSFFFYCIYASATGQWFSPGTPISSTNIIDRHDITQILLKVALSTINKPTNQPFHAQI